MIRVWFFSFCIPRPSLALSALSSLGHHVPPSIYRANSFAPFGKPQVWDVLFFPSCHPQVDRVLNKGTLV